MLTDAAQARRSSTVADMWKLAEKQKVLEILDVRKRLEHILSPSKARWTCCSREAHPRGQGADERARRVPNLNEQMKAILKELARWTRRQRDHRARAEVAEAGMPKEAREKATGELNKLKIDVADVAERRSWPLHDWLVRCREEAHVRSSRHRPRREGVDEDHYGLDKVKERHGRVLAV